MPSPKDHASYGGAAGDLPGALRAAEHPARGLQQRPLREADGGRARAEDAGPWEFPFEVEITKNKTVVYTPE